MDLGHYIKLVNEEGKLYLIECYETEDGTLIDQYPSGHFMCFHCGGKFFDASGFTTNADFEEDYPVSIVVTDSEKQRLSAVCKECFHPKMTTLYDSNLLGE